MATSISIHLILLSFLFFAAVGSCSAFNVTQALGPLRQFSTFSNYLAQVGVVGMMANLKNVTILAVDNANMGSIAGKSREEIKRAMTMHVIPEYYDLDRLRNLENGTALIRTVYVLTGMARGKDGMLLVTRRGKVGRLSFASAVLPQSKPTVTLLRSVVVPSLNVSIFQVSGVIVTPPPVVSVASEGAGSDAAGRIAVSSKLMVGKAALNGGIKAGDLNEVFMPKTLKEDGKEEEDLKTSQKAESKGEEEAPAKAPSKAPSKSPSKNAPPKKSPAKAPSPSKSSNSTSGGKKAKSPAPSPLPSSDSPAPAPSKKKKSDSPSPAPSKEAPSKSPAASKSPKAAKSSEPSPAGSSGDSPAPSKSGKGGSSSDSPISGSSSDSPASGSSPSPSDDYYTKSSPPAPAKASEAPDADSPSDEAEAPAAAPSGGAAPMSVTNVGIMMTVMALWALAA